MGPQFESHCPKPGPSLGKLRLRIIYFIFPRSHCSRQQGWSQNPGPLARLSTVRGEWEVSPFSLWDPSLSGHWQWVRLRTESPHVGPGRCSDPLLLNRSFSRLGVASLPSGPQGARPAPSAALIAESSLTRFRRGGAGAGSRWSLSGCMQRSPAAARLLCVLGQAAHPL